MPDFPADATVEVGTPYWRLDQGHRTGHHMARALFLSLRPVLRLIGNVAPGATAVIVAGQIVSGVAVTAGLVLLNDVLARLIDAGDAAMAVRHALPALLLLLLIAAVRLAAEAVASIARATLAPKARCAAESRLFAAILQVDLAAFDDADFYDRLKRARERGILHLEGSIIALVDMLGATLVTAGAVVALLVIHPALAPLLLLALAPGIWGILAAARVQYVGMDRTVALMRHADMYGELATRRSAAPEVRANAAAPWISRSFGRAAVSLRDHMIALARTEARMRAIASLLSGLGLVVAFALLGWMILRDWLDLAAAATAVAAMRGAGASLNQLVTSGRQLTEKALYIGDFEEFVQLAERKTGAERRSPVVAAPSLIQLDDVGFRYPGAVDWALRGVTLSIRAGETLALAGENGSGKSTLAKLIGGLYPATAGSIRWDGHDLATLRSEDVRAQVAMVLQEPVRWPDTARVNVEMGRPDAPSNADRLHAAAAATGADEIAARLPQGWDTLLSREFRGGHDLSAGQWQRIAIARGLYRDAPLVIWDEPTAPLDARAEVAAYCSLRRLTAGRTVLLITHRLTSIRDVDRILFLKAGQVIEQGSHAALMAMNGEYARMFELQATLYRAAAL